MPTDKVVLTQLAQAMIANHDRLSISRGAQAPLTDTESSVMVVIGAGASYDAVGLPLGRDAADLLKRRVGVPADYLERELDRLA